MPLAARAQGRGVPVIGYLSSRARERDAPFVAAFRQGLREIGFVEGQNVAIEYRWAHDNNERLPALVADLVQRQVSVIAATSGSAVAAKAATGTIPVVFSMAGDPLELQVVPSLGRPGGNVTGVTSLGVEVAPKRLEILHELLPPATDVALLVNPTGFNAGPVLKDTQVAAQILGRKLHILNASSGAELERAFASLAQLKVNGLVVGSDPFFSGHAEELAALALRHKMPTVYQYREFTAAGGLISYGSSVFELFRFAGIYTGRVLKGENPADLPIHQATKVELILNLKTAAALGLTVPLTLRVRADGVIE
jgi:putative ABC transport system substrate-binding protein